MHVSVVHDGGGVNVMVSAGGLVDVIATLRRSKHVRGFQKYFACKYSRACHSMGDLCREKVYGVFTI
jgi:hypothetical protein